ncbi:MAG: bacterial transcriptional activator domain-containing protein, partial [Ilumatobacteraceae bacterium]
DVRDATFANVVSDARRALARAVAPVEGDEWIGRTLTEHLPLHVLVVSDADVLSARLAASRGLPASEAVAVLEPGVDLIEGLPFAGGDHLWTDAEGITSSLIVLATGAAAELARHHLALGDIDGVFRATGRGLAVLGGHEELIGLRMRAHAMRGNFAGVRHEWAFYERALDADPWSSGDPSPALVSLRRELLSS